MTAAPPADDDREGSHDGRPAAPPSLDSTTASTPALLAAVAVSAGKRVIVLAAIVASVPFLLTVGVALAAEASGALSPQSPADTLSCTSTTTGSTSSEDLSSSQLANAQIIYNVSVSLGLPQQAAVIGIATAMQESSLNNLDYGDQDSLGLFQQRPSQGDRKSVV